MSRRMVYCIWRGYSLHIHRIPLLLDKFVLCGKSKLSLQHSFYLLDVLSCPAAIDNDAPSEDPSSIIPELVIPISQLALIEHMYFILRT